ncbi:MAG: fibronectin type III domain-containing protein [Candidatus Pacebacteria bacterium]|nr:fibronectin type III domain-containing protein [Candidatus Paceibacterota bacterium]
MPKIKSSIISCLLLAAFLFSSFASQVNATELLSDTFTGTTIDTVKWNETDAGGVGGTTGNIQQNGSLTMTGSTAWGTNYVVTDTTYDRSLGSLEMEADVTCASSSSIMGIGYGDPGVLVGGGESYTMYVVSNTVYFSRQLSNGNAENITTAFSCTNGVSFHIRITVGTTTGASLYINGSGTPAGTVTGGTFNNKGFFLSGHSGTATIVDNFAVNGISGSTEPDAPTDLVATPASTAMGLTWTAPASNGSAITDYLIEYKLASEPTTWTTFSDGTSTTASTTVTGLTNALSYNFRVSAINGIGTSTPSSTATGTPALSAPSAPQSLSGTSGVSGQSVLTWSAPITDGGAAITDYLVEFKLNSEPTTWTTFSDGVTATTGATVTGLVNGSLYNFRVSAVNSVGTGTVSSTANATPNTFAMTDNFTGTTIDTDKWTELDPGGTGGTVGNVQQNGDINISGTGSWGGTGLSTVQTYDRTNGDVSMTVTVTRSSCGSGVGPVAIGYGDLVFTGAGTSSYILLSNTTNWELYYWTNGANVAGSGPSASPQTLSGFTSCTSGVPFTLTLTALQGGGASVFVNGSGTASATITAGTFTNEGFWLGSLAATGTSDLDDVEIIEPATGPFAPTGLSGTAGDGEVSLSWTSGGDNGASITDYVVEYKLNSAGSWSTFADGTSASTGATVTGLTNGSLYNFRVSATNSNGNSDPSSTANATPIFPTATAPTASAVSITGSASLGELITGTYTYNDVNGNSEGTSTFRWLRADSAGGVYSAISGATSVNYTVVSADLTKYLKFEVTPVSNTSPTDGTPVLSSATSQVSEIDYVNQILSTGQSLSVGVASSPALTTTQPYSNLMLSGGNGGLGSGGSFIPLVEASVETISSSMANTITANDTGNDFDVAVSLHGVSGYTYSQLKKGQSPFTTGMTQVTNAKSAAIALGRTSRVIGVTTIHGETDNFNGISGATYQGYLEEWQNDYDTDVKAITGQSNEVILFLDQMSSFMSSYANDATSEIPIYQLYAAEENPAEIVLVAPKYFFNYSDRHHLTGASSRWLGEYYGKVIKKVVIDHETWRPLSPDSAIRSGNIIDVNFHVPAGVLAFDTTLVSARTNKGFEYYDSTSSATISSVAILDDDTVRITLSGTPTGANQRVRYAYTGVPGTDTGAQNAGSAAGNLRDTDPYTSLYGNTLYNWAVHFDEAVTLDSTAPTITDVSSSKNNGTYGEGEVIDIDVTFSEAVTSTGNVTVTLETGTVDRTCTFTVTNSDTGTCNYTVQGGDISSDLTVSSISGTIADQASNAMASFTIGTNLASNKALVIDTEDSVISLLVATPANTTSTITWTTDEISSSIVDYGLTTVYGTSTVEEDTSPRVTSHSVDIASLVACTTYHYRVRSTDGASNTATGSDNTFTTSGCVGSADVLDEETSSITANTGGTFELDLGTTGLALNIPANATGADAFYQIKQLAEADTTAITGIPSGFTLADGHIYNLTALTDVDTSVTSFDEDIEITITYEDSEILGLNESSLVIYHYSSGVWTSLTPCTVDTTLNTVTCSTSGFSIFGLFGGASASSSGGSSGSRRVVAQANITPCLPGHLFNSSTGLPCNTNITDITHTLDYYMTKNPNITIPTRDLKLNMTGEDVKQLQKILNMNGFPVAISGVGSLGQETNKFGPLTKKALIKYQQASGITPAAGYFGPKTRASMVGMGI